MIFALTLAYDGSRYFGWQRTKTGPSIQASLEKAVAQVTGEMVTSEGASRTDRGVHAEGQVAAIRLAKTWECGRLQKALNGTLPADIRVVRVETKEESFHPTLGACQKEYHYRICLGDVQEPHLRAYSWHFGYPLDLQKMEKAAADLLGGGDFSAFANEAEENPICTLSNISLIPLERGRMQIALLGDRFLYKMARNLAGTLLYIGCGKMAPNCIPALLESRDRKRAGVTAPAHGLFLHRVDYELNRLKNAEIE